MGGSESKESRKTKELAIEGVQFESVNNKCIRLYFESRILKFKNSRIQHNCSNK